MRCRVAVYAALPARDAIGVARGCGGPCFEAHELALQSMQLLRSADHVPMGAPELARDAPEPRLRRDQVAVGGSEPARGSKVVVRDADQVLMDAADLVMDSAELAMDARMVVYMVCCPTPAGLRGSPCESGPWLTICGSVRGSSPRFARVSRGL